MPARAFMVRPAAVGGLLLLALLLSAPAVSHASSRAERVAAARSFAQRTASFHHQMFASEMRARAVQTARRAAARSCLAVWEQAPLKRRSDLATIYFTTLSGARWSVHGPLYGSWVSDLRRSARVRRSPVIARAVGALHRQLQGANRGYGLFPDACGVVTAWSAAGWSDAARPAILTVHEGPPDPREVADEAADEAAIRAALRQVVRYAPRLRREVEQGLSRGFDEVDSVVNDSTECDPVGMLVIPSEYSCPPD